MLAAVTIVLERAARPMRACEIHAAAEQLAGEALRWRSVKAALAADTCGPGLALPASGLEAELIELIGRDHSQNTSPSEDATSIPATFLRVTVAM